MITYFPPCISVEEQREIKHYTRQVETDGLFPGARWVAHVEALYASTLAKTRTGKPDNASRGRFLAVSLWDAIATRVQATRLEWNADLSQRDDAGHVDLSLPYRKAEADIFCRRSHPWGRDFFLSICGAARERPEITDRRGRIAKERLKPEPCVVLIIYSEHADVKHDRRRLLHEVKSGNLGLEIPTRATPPRILLGLHWVDDVIYGAQSEKINHLVQYISEQ